MPGKEHVPSAHAAWQGARLRLPDTLGVDDNEGVREGVDVPGEDDDPETVAVEDTDPDVVGVWDADADKDKLPDKESDLLTEELSEADWDVVEDALAEDDALLETEAVSDCELDVDGVKDGDGERVGDHDPHPVPSETATSRDCTPSAAVMRLDDNAMCILSVTAAALWSSATSITRCTSSPLPKGRPFGFIGAPQPPPSDASSPPLDLSNGPNETPSTTSV